MPFACLDSIIDERQSQRQQPTIGCVEFIPDPDRVHRPTYNREPYARVTFPDGTTRDGKVVAWQDDMVRFRWVENDHDHRLLWLPAAAVRRIPRRESSWQHVYDDYAWYEAQGEL